MWIVNRDVMQLNIAIGRSQLESGCAYRTRGYCDRFAYILHCLNVCFVNVIFGNGLRKLNGTRKYGELRA